MCWCDIIKIINIIELIQMQKNLIDILVSVLSLYNMGSYYVIEIQSESSGNLKLNISQRQLDKLRLDVYSKHITYFVFESNQSKFIWSSIDNYNFLEKSFNAEFVNNIIEDSEIKIFDFKPKTEPYNFQLKIASLAAANVKYGLFLEQGLGKTKVSLDAAQYLLSKNLIDDVLVYAPASLCTNWKHEIKIHVYEEYHQKIFIESQAALSLINSTRKTKTIALYLEKMESILAGRTLLIFDEFHLFKNPESKRSNFLVKSVSDKTRMLLLTGTPNPKGILELYIPFKLFGIISENFYAYRNKYFKTEQTQFGIKVIDEFTALTNNLMSKFKKLSSWVKKEEVLELPPKIYTQLYYDLNKEQEKLIEMFLNDNDFEDKNSDGAKEQKKLKYLAAQGFGFTPKDIENIFVRILQIQNGFYLNKQGEKCEVQPNNKLNLLLEILADIPENEPIIIFCSFTYEVEAIQQKLIDAGYTDTDIRHGKLSKKKKEAAIENFVNLSNRIMVATTASTGTGFTLIQSNNIIYYSNLFGIVPRLQSEDRIHRIGQTRTCNYFDLIAPGSMDEIVFKFNKRAKGDLNDFYSFFRNKLIGQK